MILSCRERRVEKAMGIVQSGRNIDYSENKGLISGRMLGFQISERQPVRQDHCHRKRPNKLIKLWGVNEQKT